MFRPKAIVILLTLCVCVASGILIHHAYENHVSSDFKRIMSAATDVNEPTYETNSYLHDARLAVRTEKDQQILEDFENANKQLRDADTESRSILDEINDESREATTTLERFNEERQQPYADNAVIDKEVAAWKSGALAKMAKYQAEKERNIQKGLQAIQQYRKVRSELGLSDPFSGVTLPR